MTVFLIECFDLELGLKKQAKYIHAFLLERIKEL